MKKERPLCIHAFSLNAWNNHYNGIRHSSMWPYSKPEIVQFLNPDEKLYPIKSPPPPLGTNLNQDFSNDLFERKFQSHKSENLLKEFQILLYATLQSVQSGKIKHVPHVVTYRNNLNKIMASIFHRRDTWTIECHKVCDTLFLHMVIEQDENVSEGQQKAMHIGYKFELECLDFSNKRTPNKGASSASSQVEIDSNTHQSFLCDDKFTGEGHNHYKLDKCNQNSCVSHSIPRIGESGASILATALLNSNMHIVLGAEVDAYDPNHEWIPGRPEKTKTSHDWDWKVMQHKLTELKTHKSIRSQKDAINFGKFKALKIWIQSYLIGIEHAVIGHHCDGILESIQCVSMRDLQHWNHKYWSGKKCLHFTHSFLSWIGSVVSNDTESYTLSYNSMNQCIEVYKKEEAILTPEFIQEWKQVVTDNN